MLIFTDLDGTLLDHHSYDHRDALPALERLRDLQVPVILVSSKTLDELTVVMKQLRLEGPIIGENGAVIIYPGEEPQIVPPGYMQIRDFLVDSRTNPDYDTLGFGDMTVEEVMESTGLDLGMALRAMKRLGSEPFLWHGPASGLHQFRLDVARAGLRLLQGGRFYHLLGDTDKGKAVRYVTNHLKRSGYPVTTTIALGDSDNDREMLLAVDIPVIVRKHDGTHMVLEQRPRAIVTDQPGPAGWNQAVQKLLQQYGT
ncbi:MAG: HAD-IIB family hydrolase [Candidatus Thiodiazotropha sp.]|nr:HAD-IIB family hydrolase [Candidatus Thiodiazotropha sp. (ex Lucina pensylvanica)]MBT3062723.1 HAD-IIB family hydrolase [Candidatus Thiodiazotropha sp. (ex Lucina pensylvanica)]MBV2093513.1 HAD-IIB family hydrolase [Candidatus Thiodiazotropha sp. (ex Codakia orbicularis)]